MKEIVMGIFDLPRNIVAVMPPFKPRRIDLDNIDAFDDPVKNRVAVTLLSFCRNMRAWVGVDRHDIVIPVAGEYGIYESIHAVDKMAEEGLLVIHGMFHGKWQFLNRFQRPIICPTPAFALRVLTHK